MKAQCDFCGVTRRKNSKNWFLFRGNECCLACKVFIQGDNGTPYLQHRREQIDEEIPRAELDSPDDWLKSQLVTQAY